MHRQGRDKRHVAAPVIGLVVLGVMGMLIVLTGCPKGNGITVPNSDATPPGLTLGFSLEGVSGVGGTVTAGGQAQTVTLPQKTGNLSLLATATDQESGILSVGIFMEADVVRCVANSCTGPTSHGLWSTPNFVSNNAKVNPGSSGAVGSSILAQSVNLSTLITAAPANPGDKVITTIWLVAQAENQLNGTSWTPEGKMVFTETK